MLSDARYMNAQKTKTLVIPLSSPLPKEAFLILYHEGYPTKHYPLLKQKISIGTANTHDIVLKDPYVSSHHATIEKKEGLYFLMDHKSRNGTFLNNTLIRETALAHQSYIQLGKTLLQFEYKTPKLKTSSPLGDDIISQHPLMQQLFGTLEKVAPLKTTVMIYGETGTGKELIAQALHRQSGRNKNPLVTINCGAIPKELLESELFGHVKGAFTGAHTHRQGLFLAADKGTLFLDEIGELPLDLQPKLLRVLEQREIKPVGSERYQKIDVRIIAATHRNLPKMVQEETFREDLFYRLHLIPLYLPPLRDRKEDIPLLIHHFTKNMSITPKALKLLHQHSWPGNIRELKNVLERAKVLSHSPIITEKEIQETLSHSPLKSFSQTLEVMEKSMLYDFLDKNQWNKTATARALSIPKSTLLDKIKRYKIAAPRA
ncbi:MAG TPA: Fis family transcriptional regulator [Deltaproteobacteria bacterium]|nr:Fis family transcriptional regulator [Deltaproteobacteria bacterium]